MVYILLDGLASALGGFIGTRFNRHLPSKHLESLLLILNLTIVVIGIEGAIKMDSILLMLVSVCIGSIIGVSLDIDSRFKGLGKKLEEKFKGRNLKISEGFITLTIIQCVGAMAILGPLKLMLEGDSSIILVKAVLDFVTSIVFGATLGIGVIFASIPLIIYEGLIYFLAGLIKPILTDIVINQISAIGSLLILALGIDLLGLKEIKIANYLPSVLVPLIFAFLKLFISR